MIAHTLSSANASARVLTKSGFRYVGQVIDPEDGEVCRWERHEMGESLMATIATHMRIHVWTAYASRQRSLRPSPSDRHLFTSMRSSKRRAPSISKKRRFARSFRISKSGRRTARQIASAYIARIQALDRNGPSLHSVIELNPDALAIADALDAERGAGRCAGRFTAFRC